MEQKRILGKMVGREISVTEMDEIVGGLACETDPTYYSSGKPPTQDPRPPANVD